MSALGDDKRRIERIRLDCPLRARLNTVAVSLVDLSVNGARIEHTTALQTGRQVHLEFSYLEREISIACSVLRCKLQRGDAGVIYSSGLRYDDPKDPAVAQLRQVIAEIVQRDLKAMRQHARYA